MRDLINIVESARLAQLPRKAEEKGIELRLKTAGNTIVLDWIANNSRIRGAAKVVMTELCTIADEEGKRIVLYVRDADEALISYYEGFGFILDTSTRQDAEPMMVRTPFTFTTLPTGTVLYHGTNEAAEFSIPHGPAWFGEDRATAEKWQDWATPKERGTPRVLVVRTTRPLRLLEMNSYPVWQRLSSQLCREDEAPYGMLALAMKKAGYDGWYSDTEVMICNTEEVLEPVDA